MTFHLPHTVSATFVEAGKADFQGGTLSLSVAALKALHGFGHSLAAQAIPSIGCSRVNLLNQRLTRMEAKRFDEIPTPRI